MSIALDVGPVSVRTSTQHAVHAAAAIALRSARAGLGLVFGDRALRRAELELAARARAIDRARQRGAARWWVRVFVLASWLCRRGVWLLCHALGRAIAPTLLARQVVVAGLLQCAIGLARGGTAAWARALGALGEQVGIISAARRRALLLRAQLAHARTHDEHVRLCEELDTLEGGAAWRGRRGEEEGEDDDEDGLDERERIWGHMYDRDGGSARDGGSGSGDGPGHQNHNSTWSKGRVRSSRNSNST